MTSEAAPRPARPEADMREVLEYVLRHEFPDARESQVIFVMCAADRYAARAAQAARATPGDSLGPVRLAVATAEKYPPAGRPA